MTHTIHNSPPKYQITGSLPNDTPYFDLGTVDEIFERLGRSDRSGKAKDRFVQQAQGKVVLRVGFDLVAIDKYELDPILDRAGVLADWPPAYSHWSEHPDNQGLELD